MKNGELAMPFVDTLGGPPISQAISTLVITISIFLLLFG